MTQVALEELTLESRNVRLIGANNINQRGKLGEGIALQKTGNRKICYLAHESGPTGFTVMDVTNPRDPGIIAEVPTEHDRVRLNSLSLSGDILVTARQTVEFGGKPAGVAVYDVSKPESPREISFFDTSGPYSRGCHFVWFVDGRYMHLSTGMPDFKPSNMKDDQFYVIVDMANPEKPSEVGRWWVPGMKDGEQPLPRHPILDAGHRMHNSNVLPSRPDRAYTGFLDSGMYILDISDLQKPRPLGHWNPAPPYMGFTHTVSPILDRGIAIVSEESTRPQAGDWPKLTWILNISVEENPVPIGTVPLPDPETHKDRGGRFGSHNIYEDHEQPTSAVLKNTTVGAFFNGGIRIYDLRNPLRAEEIGYFIPKGPANSPFAAAQMNDLFVDEAGLIYGMERMSGGLYILEYTGDVPLN